ncbi:MAG: class I SAM-dependent methyltransferase [Actinomycetota bacterium]|nr:class I SAM-dependent methyltransferase [Actinomycetota bacterium]
MAALARRYRLPLSAARRLEMLLDGLAAEPDPPTGVTEPKRAVETHLADSLSGLEIDRVRSAPALVDLGAGAGFPGLPLAVALPNARIDLVEAGRRKCEVIERLRDAAGAANARVVATRAETWALGEGADAYAVATARALAPLSVLCEYAAPLLEPGGALVCWKGTRDGAEEAAGAAAASQLGLYPAEVRRVEPFPGARSRHLHVFVKAGPTPARFPRRPGIAAKRPLGR